MKRNAALGTALGGQASADFSTATARASDLGTTDLLLVIALNDRAYGYWKGDNVAGLDDASDLDVDARLAPLKKGG